MRHRSAEKRSADRRTLRDESSRHAGHMAASSALLVCILTVAICAVPSAPASAANEMNQSSVGASLASAQTSAAAQTALAWLSFSEDANEENPLHLPRPRVMALIGVGLLAVGVFLRRREGRKGV